MRQHLGKNIFILLMIVALFLVGCSQSENVVSEQEIEETADDKGTDTVIGELTSRTGTDVVLVMDESGSMFQADKDRIAIEGAKMFIDMEKSSDANIALVEFSNYISSTGMIEMKQQQNKEYMKSILDGVQYGGSAHTDTGAGLLEAVSVLDGMENENSKAIILFTDGRTDIDAGTPGRTTQDSINDAEMAAKQAADKGYTIYCIGLNANNSVDEAELGKIAVMTGGQYHIATDVNELPDFFNQIFADIDDAQWKTVDEFEADEDYRDVYFTIDNRNVMEANLVILSSQQVEDVILTDYTGSVVDIEADNKVIFTNSSKYSLVKLIYPEMGDWSISVKGVSGDHIKIGLIYNYDVVLLVKADKTEVVRGRDITVKAYLASGGEIMEDNTFYKNMGGYYVAAHSTSGEAIKGDLTLSEGGNAFVGTFTPPEIGEYHVFVHLEGNGFYRDSEMFTVHATKNPVVIRKTLPEFELRIGQTEEIDLTDYFEDEDGDQISYSVTGQDEILDVAIEKNMLQIEAKQVGETEITIHADNGSSEEGKQTVTVKAVSFMTQAVKILVPVLVGLLLVLAVYLIRRGKERLSGVFQVTVEWVMNDANGIPQTEEYVIRNTISASFAGKRSFTLRKLITQIQGYYLAVEYDADKKKSFEECMNIMMSEAGKIKIYGSRKKYEIKLVNKSQKAKFVNMGTVTERKILVLSLEDNDMLTVMAQEKKFGIQFTDNKNEYVQINMTYKKM